MLDPEGLKASYANFCDSSGFDVLLQSFRKLKVDHGRELAEQITMVILMEREEKKTYHNIFIIVYQNEFLC